MIRSQTAPDTGLQPLRAGSNSIGPRSPSGEPGIGRRLREMRAARSLSLRALAKLSGVNINTLRLIENDRSSPSVSTLQRLAQCLGVPLADFFRTDGTPRRVVHVKSGSPPGIPIEAGTMQDLAAGMQAPGAEPLLLSLEPGASSGRTPIVHTGREFIYCLEGQVDYTVDGIKYTLTPGDSLCYEAYLPHQWKNEHRGPARVLIVLCSLEAREDVRERHFAGRRNAMIGKEPMS